MTEPAPPGGPAPASPAGAQPATQPALQPGAQPAAQPASQSASTSASPAPAAAASPSGAVPPGDGIPRATVSRRRRRSISLVWVIPAVAVVIGLYLVFHALRTQGPTIEIRFKTAEGLEAGKTKIKYKNVDVGTVQNITLGADRKVVIVTAKMTRNATDLLVEDTRFWIVKPRIAGGQVSGLTTLLSGSYIGMDVGKSQESRREYDGLDVQPAVTTDEPGREFLLHAPDIGSLDIGSPVFFRRFQVGEVTAISLDDDGKGVTAHVFIHSPNEKYVTKNTRFWQASGVDVAIDGAGVKVSTQSLLAVLVGGVAFQSPDNEPPGPQVANDQSFTLASDERTAMKRSDAQLEKYIAYFNDSVRGLTVGAPVEFRGFVVGEVRSIEMEFDRATKNIRFPVEFALYRDVLPARIARADKEGKPIDREALYAHSVEQRGLRAQLRTGNLLTGTKYLDMDFFKNAPPLPKNTVLMDAHGNRVLPTIPGALDELQETVSNIAKKIEKIPFEQLGTELRNTLRDTQVTLKSVDRVLDQVNTDIAPAVTQTLDQVKRTMKNANDVLASDAPLQTDLRNSLLELDRAAASLRQLADYLQRHPESLLRGKAPDTSFGDVPATPPNAAPPVPSKPVTTSRPEASR